MTLKKQFTLAVKVPETDGYYKTTKSTGSIDDVLEQARQHLLNGNAVTINAADDDKGTAAEYCC